MAEVEGLRTISPQSPLGLALERGREGFNARVVLARRSGRPVDPGALARHLADAVAPTVAAVAAVAPARVDAVTAALFDLSLDLVAGGVLGPGSRHPFAVAAWCDVLPRLARTLAEEPRLVAAAVTNAACNLGMAPGARPAAWLDELAGLAGDCASARELLECGKVLAWRSGLAQVRDSALAVWQGLPDRLARRCLGLDGDAPVSRDELRECLADPWRRPGAGSGPRTLRVVAVMPGFRSFGGPFLAPPQLLAAREHVWAIDPGAGGRAFCLHADCFGQALTPATAAPPAEENAGFRMDARGKLSFAGLEAHLPELAGTESAAATGSVVAVRLPRSHRIHLVAATVGGGG